MPPSDSGFPIVLFERFFLRPWDDLHNRWPERIDGNTTAGEAWRSRPPTPAYGVALAAFSLCAISGVSSLARWLRPTDADAGGYSDFAACCFILGLLLNASFAYTNYVTTARSSLFCGLHGGLRDIVFVNLSVPAVVWWARLHEPGRLFPIPSSLNGAPAESPLAEFFGAHAAGVGLVAGLLLGLHILHLARGRFDGSISGVDVAKGRLSSIATMAAKLALIAYLTGDHFAWLRARGEALWGTGVTLAVIGALALLTWALQAHWYLHLHHWFMGLALSPLAVCDPPWWSGVLLGVALGQYVEGASRWSCAPIWNSRSHQTSDDDKRSSSRSEAKDH